MARIAGVNIPTNKRVIIALTYIHGIGAHKAKAIADKLGIDHSRRVQDLSDHHVGKLTGLMSMWVWAITSPMHSAFGALIDRSHSFDMGMACAGLAPLLGVVSLALLWKEKPVTA